MRRLAFVSFIILSIQVIFWMPPVARTADKGAVVPQGLRFVLGDISPLDKATGQRMFSVLQNMKKNLILDQTRGQKDVELYAKVAPAVVLIVTTKGFGRSRRGSPATALTSSNCFA